MNKLMSNMLFGGLLMLMTVWSLAQTPFSRFQSSFETFVIPTNTCVRLETASGSLIFIEDGFFEGVSDSVRLHYRELRDVSDMIIHGVGMQTVVQNERRQLVSMGMFEMYAFNQDDTLAFNPRKRIAVYLSQKDTDTDITPSGYVYEKATDNWLSSDASVDDRRLANDEEEWGSAPVNEPNASFIQSNMDDPFSAIVIEQSEEVQQAYLAMDIQSFGMHNYDYVLPNGNMWRFVRFSRRQEANLLMEPFM